MKLSTRKNKLAELLIIATAFTLTSVLTASAATINNFSYTGASQTYTVPVSGIYQIQS